jgi:hypothetical protein
MSGTTSVPKPVFGATGFIAPTEAAILAGVQADMNAAFGGNLNQSLSTPQGQLASSTTAIIGDCNNQFVYYTNQVDPAFAEGRMQDAIARIYFLTRNPAQPTTVTATCSGLAGVVIPVGALAQDTSGNTYAATEAATIPAGGSVAVSFANIVDGPVACPAGALATIYRAIPGWDSVTNAAGGILGNSVEGRADFEARRAASVALNAIGSLDSIRANVLAVPDVLDVYATENTTDAPVSTGGVTIAAHSVYVCVAGGASAAIALAIWTKKATGCGYTGNTTIKVVDDNYGTPKPSYNVKYQTPTATPIYFRVTIANNALVPSNALTLIRAAITNAFTGGDGGSQARIGSTLFASRYYAAVASLGAWAQIVSLQIGANAASVVTGSIGGTTLTVSAVTSGTLAVGQVIYGTSIASGTVITALGSGTGGTGTYTINNAQSVSSTTVSATTLVNSVTMNIDQAPTIADASISLALV